MPNYILTLQNRVAELEKQVRSADEGVVDLYRYLQSPKFRKDTTVQVGDIFLRLDQNVRPHLHL